MRTKRRKKLFAVLSGFALTAFAGPVFAYFFFTDIFSASLEYEKSRAESIAAGNIVDSKSYLAMIRGTPEQNAAAEMGKLIELEKQYPKLFVQYPDEKEVLKNWSSVSKALEIAERAESKSFCLYDRDYTKVSNIANSDSFVPARVARVLSVQAEASRKSNDLLLARRCWRAAATISRFLDDEQSLINQLVRMGTASYIEQSLFKEFNRKPPSKEEATSLREVTDILDQPFDPSKMMGTEHWFATEGFISMSSSEVKELLEENSLGTWLPRIPRFKEACLARIHAIYTDFQNNCPPEDKYELETYQDAFSVAFETSQQEGLSYSLASIQLHAYQGYMNTVAAEYARRNVLIQYLTILSTDASTSNLPLGGRHLVDTDGEPIRLKKIRSKRVIYSVGLNQKDEEGVGKQRSKSVDDYEDKVEELPDDFSVVLN